jgi:hypothetical protein
MSRPVQTVQMGICRNFAVISAVNFRVGDESLAREFVVGSRFS